MTFRRNTRLALALCAPLALGLAACSGTEDTDESLAGEPIAAIPAPEGTSWLETVTVTPEGGYKVGNPDAPLKLIEYASHTCGACANFAVNGKPALKESYINSGVVSFEQREVFLNINDVVIARLAQCGAKESMQTLSDAVWQDLQTVITNIQSNAPAIQAAGELPLNQRLVRIGEANGMIAFFAARGLSADQARECLADAEAIDAMVTKAEAQAREDNVTGTPTFVLNGNRVDANQWPGLEPILQRAGAR